MAGVSLPEGLATGLALQLSTTMIATAAVVQSQLLQIALSTRYKCTNLVLDGIRGKQKVRMVTCKLHEVCLCQAVSSAANQRLHVALHVALVVP